MNTKLLKMHCGIDIPDIDRRALRSESVKLTAHQTERLKAWPRGLNTGIVSAIEASRITYKKKPTGTVRVTWRQTPTCGMSHYFSEEVFQKVIQ